MRTMTLLLAASLAAAACLPACGENQGSGAPAAASTPANTAAADSAKPVGAAPTGNPAPASAAVDKVEAPPSSASAAVPAASGSAAVPAASGSAAAGAKKFDCGAKGQKPCPMQGWMKTVMAAASSSGEGPKLAQALEYVAAHVPPGYGNWAAMASAGAAKAKAGDIDGAKASCKQCHDAYKDDYKAKMRDRPF